MRRWRRRPCGRRARPRGRSAASWRRSARRAAPRAHRGRPRTRPPRAWSRRGWRSVRPVAADRWTGARHRGGAPAASSAFDALDEILDVGAAHLLDQPRAAARAQLEEPRRRPGRARTPDPASRWPTCPRAPARRRARARGPSARVTRRSSRRSRRRSRPRPFTSGSASRKPPRRDARAMQRLAIARFDARPGARQHAQRESRTVGGLWHWSLRGRMPILAHVISAPCASPQSTSEPTRFT